MPIRSLLMLNDLPREFFEILGIQDRNIEKIVVTAEYDKPVKIEVTETLNAK